MEQQKRYEETLCAPAGGHVLRMGRGRCVISFADENNGDVVSPVSGTVTHIGAGGNRISICSGHGTEISVGIGDVHPGARNTAVGCHFYVQTGERVNAGQRIMHAELSRIRRRGGGAECVMEWEETDERMHLKRGTGESVRAGVTPLLRVREGEEGRTDHGNPVSEK